MKKLFVISCLVFCGLSFFYSCEKESKPTKIELLTKSLWKKSAPLNDCEKKNTLKFIVDQTRKSGGIEEVVSNGCHYIFLENHRANWSFNESETALLINNRIYEILELTEDLLFLEYTGEYGTCRYSFKH